MFEHAFYASWGQIPRLTKTEVRGNLLLVRPEIKGTGTVHIPFAHPGYGIMVRSTETLQQRSRPYLLLKELGRGELGRLLRLLQEWKTFGFVPSDAIDRKIRGMIHSFGSMVTSDETNPAVERAAAELFQHLGSLGTHLVDQFFEHTVTRQRSQACLAIPWGVFLGRETPENLLEKFRSLLNHDAIRPAFDETFQFVAATPSWKVVEPSPGKFQWEPVDQYFNLIEKLGKTPLVGPILSFDPASLPRWVLKKIDNHESLEDAAVRYTIEFVKRYRRRSSHWIISGNIFSSPECGFSIGRGAALICDLVREVKYAIRDKTVLVTIDQPCGDYYRTNDCPLPFIAIIESLASVRSLDGFLLDFKLGMGQRDTLPRDPILLSRHLDQWNIWGKKLFVSFSVPSRWNGFQERETDDQPKQAQQEWAVRMILMSLTKRNIHGIFWNPLLDTSGEQPDGLIGTDGQTKPVLHEIAALRQMVTS